VGNASQPGTGQAWNCEAAGGGKNCEGLPECKECCCVQTQVHEEIAIIRRLQYVASDAYNAGGEGNGVLV